jgi:hypothetical protein
VITIARASNAERRHLSWSTGLWLKHRCQNRANLKLLLSFCFFFLFLLLLLFQLDFSILIFVHHLLFLFLFVSLLMHSHCILFPHPPCQPLLHAALTRIRLCPVDTISILHFALPFTLLPLSIPVVHEYDGAVLLRHKHVRNRCTFEAGWKERGFVHLELMQGFLGGVDRP